MDLFVFVVTIVFNVTADLAGDDVSNMCYKKAKKKRNYNSIALK